MEKKFNIKGTAKGIGGILVAAAGVVNGIVSAVDGFSTISNRIKTRRDIRKANKDIQIPEVDPTVNDNTDELIPMGEVETVEPESEE